MRSDTAQGGWHRFVGWWRGSMDTPPATSAHAAERNAARNPEELNAWENEGGAVAGRATVPKDLERPAK
jgi:hypothetical protein